MDIVIDKIVRSRRRTISIEITRGAEIIVRAPKKTPYYVIQDLVEQKRGWIEEKRAQVKLRDEKYPPKRCIEGEQYLLEGEKLSLSFSKSAKEVIAADGRLIVPASLGENAQEALTQWYRKKAREVLCRRVEFYEGIIGVRCEAVTITGALTRWGSCSGNNRLSFTWRLVMAPLYIIDYVVVHELCHILHHDHSPAFWQSVESVLPDHMERREWLRQNSALLRRDFFA